MRWVMAAIMIVVLAVSAMVALAWAVNAAGVSPRLLGPYLERRSTGHNQFIEKVGRGLNRLLLQMDRGALQPRPSYPSWALPPRPPADVSDGIPVGREILISSAGELQSALNSARPGDVITILPGTYQFAGRALEVSNGGQSGAPITLRAAESGTVTLKFAMLEGFHVRGPYWVFENLRIIGACGDHDDCEHAFHIVGAANHVVVRNNDLQDFNAHIKINGVDGVFPDNGRIESNRLTNGSPRRTSAPVTPIDLVAASGWVIEGNFIADFVKAGGDQTSYGAFAKGGGSANRFTRNVVLCEHRLRGQAGRRVGLSFGGGGTNPQACRDRRCIVEQERGFMTSNLVASCSDSGMYINRSAQTEISNNTLLDTGGITVQSPASSARVDGNLMDGPIIDRHDAILDLGDNLAPSLPMLYLGIASARSAFVSPADLDLRWSTAPPRRPDSTESQTGEADPDLCGQTRHHPPVYGAFQDFQVCMSPR